MSLKCYVDNLDLIFLSRLVTKHIGKFAIVTESFAEKTWVIKDREKCVQITTILSFLIAKITNRTH
jgi:hypothetical protein